MKKFVKKFIAFYCALLLFVTVLPFTASASGSSSGTAKLVDPDCTVAVSPSTIAKGGTFEALFTFTQDFDKDIAGYDADDIDNITIIASSVTDAININKATFSKKNGDIIDDYDSVGKTETESGATIRNYNLLYTLKIPEKYMKRTSNDYGALKFKITYYDKGNDKLDEFTVQKTVFARNDTTSSNSESAALSVSSYSINPAKELKEGDKFNLKLVVKNSSSVTCKNVAVNLTLDGNIYTNGTTNTRHLDALGAGDSAEVSFPLSCMSKMETKSYPITVNLTSPDAAAAANPPVIYIPVTGTMKNKEDSSGLSSSKPQIFIESYDYGGLSVTGGKTFTLTMNFKNTSPTVAIENLKMTVAAASDGDKGVIAFTPANSSNTFFMSKVKGGAGFQKKIDLYPKIDADPKSYGITVSYTYEAVVDGTRQDKLEGTETIAIPLSQPDRFQVNDAELQNPIFMGEPGQLNINYVNKGKSKIFNLSVKLEGNFTTTEVDTYIGNVESGTGDSFQAELTPAQVGPLNGVATFSYEDANGNTKELKKEFSCDVTEAQNPESGMDGEKSTDVLPQESKGFPIWKIALIAVGGVLVLVIALVIIRKKLKAKKQRMLEADDDYDDDLLKVTPKDQPDNKAGEEKK